MWVTVSIPISLDCSLNHQTEFRVLYSKEFVWSFSWVAGREFLNPWNFMNDRIAFVILRGPLDHTWVYANEMTQDGTGQDQTCDWRIGALSPRRGRRTGDWVQSHNQWFSQSCLCNETPIKTQLYFLVGEYINVPGGWCILIPEGEGMEALCSGPSQTSPYVSLHLARSDFIFYNKTVVVSIGLSGVLWVVLANSEGVLENPPDL